LNIRGYFAFDLVWIYPSKIVFTGMLDKLTRERRGGGGEMNELIK